MKNILFLLLVVVLFPVSCNKATIQQPGDGDYCVCTINGQSWAAGCSGSFTNCLTSEWSDSRKAFSFDCSNDQLQDVVIAIYDTVNGLKSGTYTLNTKNFSSANYRDYGKSFDYYYKTDSAYTGTVTISFDSTLGNGSYIYRVSGTFSFKAIFDTGSSTINVVSGKFSLPCHVD